MENVGEVKVSTFKSYSKIDKELKKEVTRFKYCLESGHGVDESLNFLESVNFEDDKYTFEELSEEESIKLIVDIQEKFDSLENTIHVMTEQYGKVDDVLNDYEMSIDPDSNVLYDDDIYVGDDEDEEEDLDLEFFRESLEINYKVRVLPTCKTTGYFGISIYLPTGDAGKPFHRMSDGLFTKDFNTFEDALMYGVTYVMENLFDEDVKKFNQNITDYIKNNS